MRIDNSMARSFQECGLKYWERYVQNIEPITRSSDALEFGDRMHKLLELRHKTLQGVALPEFTPITEPLESEAQLTFAAYEAHYPEEPFEVVGVERYFEVELPGCGEPSCCPYNHTYCGEFDAICRMKDSGRLWLLETKTEKRGGKDNLPEGWQQKSQVGLYLWAAEKTYGEEFEGILLNIITRQSPKGQERPSFRRDSLQRTTAQQSEAVRNLVWIADRIEECQRAGYFPSNRNHCVSPWGWKCDYFALHSTEERSEELVQIKFKQAEPYLSGL